MTTRMQVEHIRSSGERVVMRFERRGNCRPQSVTHSRGSYRWTRVIPYNFQLRTPTPEDWYHWTCS
jgi:hypothetical protein